jgi:Mn-dependent DtxR family transcriptional regulator
MLFDPHGTGDTGLALQALKRRNYVEMGPDRVVKITESGLRLLEERL